MKTPFPRAVVKTQDFTPEMLNDLFDRARTMKGRREKILEGMIMCSLFYEPSTRTRLSFESAMYQLGGNVMGTENAKEFSSIAKGESLEDSIRVIGRYCDLIVLRHTEDDAAVRAAAVSPVPLINAGCGIEGQHPTQAFLDLFTMENHFGSIEDLTIGFMGDIKNSRVIRSGAYLLGKFKGVEQHFISPRSLGLANDMRAHFAEHNINFREYETPDNVIKKLDVLYVTRAQLERMTKEEQLKYRDGSGYKVDKTLASRMQEGALLMHPLPRVDEISLDVDDLPGSVYLNKQIDSGLCVRMALLAMMLGK